MNGGIKKVLKKLACVCISILFMTVSAKATLVDSNSSIIVDNIEYYMQTNKSVYDLGENVEMLFRVTNLRDEEVSITCSQIPVCDLWVQRDVVTVWRKYGGGYTVLSTVDLLPGEYEELTHSWDMKDDDGVMVEPGLYSLVGLMYNQPWNYAHYGEPIISKVGLEITIIPEPSTIVLFGTGLAGLLFCRKRRR